MANANYLKTLVIPRLAESLREADELQAILRHFADLSPDNKGMIEGRLITLNEAVEDYTADLGEYGVIAQLNAFRDYRAGFGSFVHPTIERFVDQEITALEAARHLQAARSHEVSVTFANFEEFEAFVRSTFNVVE
jgi:hypothetical protein